MIPPPLSNVELRRLAGIVWILWTSGQETQRDMIRCREVFGVSRSAMDRAIERARRLDRELCAPGFYTRAGHLQTWGGHPVDEQRDVVAERRRTARLKAEQEAVAGAGEDIIRCKAHTDERVWCGRYLDESGSCVEHGGKYRDDMSEETRELIRAAREAAISSLLKRGRPL